MPQNILVSQDLSSFGDVSLMTAVPLLSASGLETTVLPTALLSTHTGGFGQNTYLDLSQEMKQIISHWQKLELKFDAVYLGYLGQKPLQQLQAKLASLSAPDCLTLIDPVMGDHGRLYSGFDDQYVSSMRELVKQASILTPNLTEAAFLLDSPELIDGGLAGAKKASFLLHEKFQISTVLITGVATEAGQIAVVGYEGQRHEYWSIKRPLFAANFFGTGDLFASALISGLLHKLPPYTAAESAMDLISQAIANRDPQTDPRLGLNYATALPAFIHRILQEE
ncbi:pyridoxal kinase [Ligilactobacillus salitolerans]|uniref:pyridoxal kinase n=1 Tax=Ligilactobacillus salitolerans TaxID=1808352 RepID=A0A401IS10_9LACO|nr:pyridoxamine kinase [Ligilactobacillus salitolerans]GBG94296.1 pyridoxal kinase [Ligilactobacillus salitolerans]